MSFKKQSAIALINTIAAKNTYGSDYDAKTFFQNQAGWTASNEVSDETVDTLRAEAEAKIGLKCCFMRDTDQKSYLLLVGDHNWIGLVMDVNYEAEACEICEGGEVPDEENEDEMVECPNCEGSGFDYDSNASYDTPWEDWGNDLTPFIDSNTLTDWTLDIVTGFVGEALGGYTCQPVGSEVFPDCSFESKTSSSLQELEEFLEELGVERI